jgi:hypothetical protein
MLAPPPPQTPAPASALRKAVRCFVDLFNQFADARFLSFCRNPYARDRPRGHFFSIRGNNNLFLVVFRRE